MSNILKKNSHPYQEDMNNKKISYLDFKKINQNIFCDEIPNEEAANELLNKLKDLKKAIKERKQLLHNKSLSEGIENQNNIKEKQEKTNIQLNHRVDPNKTSFIQLYKKHLRLKDYKDISPINILTNSNNKSRCIIGIFTISKENLTLRIDNKLEDGRKNMNLLLKHEIIKEENKKNKEQKEKEANTQEEDRNSGIIFTYDTQNDDEDIFNITQAKHLINTINLEIMDSRDIALIMKDVTIAMVRIIEEKFGKRDKNGLDLGITHRILNEIFKIKKPEKTVINKSDTSNKEADSVQSEKGGYEDDLELEYDDEDQY